MIGCWAGREHDVSGPDGCYGLPTLFGSNHLPATSTNLTIFHNSKTTRRCSKERSHIPRYPHIGFSHTQDASDNCLCSAHSDPRCHHPVKRTEHRPAFRNSICTLETTPNSTCLSAFHRSFRPALLGRREQDPSAAIEATHSQWRTYASPLACNVSTTYSLWKGSKLTDIRVNTVSWLSPCSHDSHRNCDNIAL